MTPTSELGQILAGAYPRCKSLKGNCTRIRCDATAGFIPRGFTGAFGRLSDVKLVLVLAEPGNPKEGTESYKMRNRSGEELVAQVAGGVAGAIKDGKSAFHKNLREILDACWPQTDFDEQMKRTWITESVLCSSKKAADPLPRQVERTCAEMYLAPQIRILPEAFVVCLGGKAAQRMSAAGLRYDLKAGAPGLPGGNFKSSKESWKRVGQAFKKHLALAEPPA